MTFNDELTSEYPPLNKPLILFFCGYVIVWYLQIGIRYPALGSIRFEFIYAAVLGMIALTRINTRKIEWQLLPLLTVFFLLLLVFVICSYDFNVSLDIFIDRVVKFAIMAFFVAVFVDSPKALIFFLAAFLLACMKMGQEGFIGNLTGSMIWENQGVLRLHGSTPNYAHPNSFAGMALGTIPFVYCLWPLSKSYVKLGLAALGIFALNIIIFTASRTGYIAIVVFYLFALYRSERKRMMIVGGLIFALVAVSYFHQYTERFDTIFTLEDKEGRSIETRETILKDALSIFVQHPLGVGVGAFPSIRRDTFGRTQDTHNLYLEVATNVGIEGLIIFMLFIVKMLRILSNIKTNTAVQIQLMLEKISTYDEKDDQLQTLQDHLNDLKLINSVGYATFLFIIIRLALGLFGMDLYEIYWWFAFGLTTALLNLNSIAQDKTQNFCGVETIELTQEPQFS